MARRRKPQPPARTPVPGVSARAQWNALSDLPAPGDRTRMQEAQHAAVHEALRAALGLWRTARLDEVLAARDASGLSPEALCAAYLAAYDRLAPPPVVPDDLWTVSGLKSPWSSR